MKASLSTDNTTYDLSGYPFKGNVREFIGDYSAKVAFLDFPIPKANIDPESLLTVGPFTFKVVRSGYEGNNYVFYGQLDYQLNDLVRGFSIKKGASLKDSIRFAACESYTLDIMNANFQFCKNISAREILDSLTKSLKIFYTWNKTRVELIRDGKLEVQALDTYEHYDRYEIIPKTYQEKLADKLLFFKKTSQQAQVVVSKGVKELSLFQRVSGTGGRELFGKIIGIKTFITNAGRSSQTVYVI